MISGRKRWWIGLTVVVAPCALSPAPHARAQEPDGPTIEVVDGPYVDAPTFQVNGSGFGVDTLVQLEVCGNQARNGSVDCQVGKAQIVAADSLGTFRGRVSASPPPTPCPCVVRAVSQSSGEIATAAVRIQGVPEFLPGDFEIAAPALQRMELSSVSVTGGGPWTAWLGAAPTRVVRFELVNTGSADVTNAVVSLSFGPKNSPTGFVAPVQLGRVPVGETRSVEIPITLESLTFGEVTIRGEITGTTDPLSFVTSTSSYPWGLVVIPAVVALQAVLLIIRNRARRRLTQRADLQFVASLDRIGEPLAVLVEGYSPSVRGDFARAARAWSDDVLYVAARPEEMLFQVFVRGQDGARRLLQAIVVGDDSGLALRGAVARVFVFSLDGPRDAEVQLGAESMATWLTESLGVRAAFEAREVGGLVAISPPRGTRRRPVLRDDLAPVAVFARAPATVVDISCSAHGPSHHRALQRSLTAVGVDSALISLSGSVILRAFVADDGGVTLSNLLSVVATTCPSNSAEVWSLTNLSQAASCTDAELTTMGISAKTTYEWRWLSSCVAPNGADLPPPSGPARQVAWGAEETVNGELVDTSV